LRSIAWNFARRQPFSRNRCVLPCGWSIAGPNRAQ